MKIILSPIASERDTTVSVDGLTVTVDGESYDLSVIPEGGQAEAEENSPFVGIVTRDEVTVKYFYDSASAVPQQSTNWSDYTFNIVSGAVPDPIVRKPQETTDGV